MSKSACKPCARSGPRADFEPLAASFKRIQNILKQAQFEGVADALKPALLEAGPGSGLYEEFERIAR